MSLPLSLLPSFVYAADVSTRQDAIRGAIANERDYVSSWLATLRNSWRMHGGKGETYFRSLPGKIETKSGCDGMFLVVGAGRLKIMLFEAKVLNRRMDSHQRRPSPAAILRWGAAVPPLSHFSDQLARQADWLAAHHAHAIVEMFINLRPPVAPFIPPLFDPSGSTCVRHDVALQHVNPPLVGGVPQIPPGQKWRANPDVIQIAGVGSANWYDEFQEFVNCRLGRPIVVPGAVESDEWFRHVNQILGEFGEGVEIPEDALNNLIGLDAVWPTITDRLMRETGLRFLACFFGDWPAPHPEHG